MVVLDRDHSRYQLTQREGGGFLNKMGRSVVATETDRPDWTGLSGSRLNGGKKVTWARRDVIRFAASTERTRLI